MRITLKITSGPAEGRQEWLSAGKVLEVGRTERADFVIPQDGTMSGRHFALRCGHDRCLVQDLGSTNGTFLGGEKITEAVLSDGDEIRAGMTVFTVRVEGAKPDDPSAAAPRPAAVEPTSTVQAFPSSPGEQPAAGQAPPMPAGGIRGTVEDFPKPAAARPKADKERVVDRTFLSLKDALAAQGVVNRAAEPPPDSPPLKGVVLEIESDAADTRREWIRPPATFVVGRTEAADFPVPYDNRMSGRHFALECDLRCCRLRDLGSSNGTFLNDKKVQQAVLYNGDRILAGGTIFRLRISGGPAAAPPPEKAEPQPAAPRAAPMAPEPVAAEPQSAALATVKARKIRCASGCYLFRGESEDFDPARLVVRFSPLGGLHMIVHRSRLAEDSPLASQGGVFLYDWFAEQLREKISPALIGPIDDAEMVGHAASAWGDNAVAFLFSQQPAERLALCLRGLARGEPPDQISAGDPAAPLAFAEPAVMAELLANSSDFQTAFFQSFDAALMEIHTGDRWGLFAKNDIAEPLEQLGLEVAP